MKKKKCINGCCDILTVDYISPIGVGNDFSRVKKSGVVLHDRVDESILMVQSRGNLWGIPKGTVEKGETHLDGAIRELYEETGIRVDRSDLGTYQVINKDVIYFYMNYKKNDVQLQQHFGTDVNSIGWIKIECLKTMIKNDYIKVTRHFAIVLKSIFELG